MKNKAFSLVEVVIVMVIIGILAGLLLLALGSSTDKAEATKIINALRSYRSAAMMYYGDYNEWPLGNHIENSLDYYMDRSLDKNMFEEVLTQEIGSRTYIGLKGQAKSSLSFPRVQRMLEASAVDSALYSAGGQRYSSGMEVYTNLK